MKDHLSSSESVIWTHPLLQIGTIKIITDHHYLQNHHNQSQSLSQSLSSTKSQQSYYHQHLAEVAFSQIFESHHFITIKIIIWHKPGQEEMRSNTVAEIRDFVTGSSKYQL